jgi:hypothetical protein
MDHRSNGITCSTYLGSCVACGYQFTNQEILYSLFFPYTFFTTSMQCKMWWILCYKFIILYLNLIRNRSLKLTLVSSANNIGSDTECIVRGRSFMYVTNSSGPRIDCWVTLYPRDKMLRCIRWFYLRSCYLNRTWTNLQILLRFHRNAI